VNNEGLSFKVLERERERDQAKKSPEIRQHRKAQ
jgi:hypothetical protein